MAKGEGLKTRECIVVIVGAYPDKFPTLALSLMSRDLVGRVLICAVTLYVIGKLMPCNRSKCLVTQKVVDGGHLGC